MSSIFSSSDSSFVSGRKAIRAFVESSVYPVVEPERLLSSAHRLKILQEIKMVIELPDEYFDALYRNLIESFTAFVQILPVNNEARLSSLLDEGLLRALFALQVQQKSAKEDVDHLLSYVLFSSCLLFDVACVVESRTVIISEQGGSFIRIWQPMRDGSLPIGGFYRIRRGGGLAPWSCRRNVVTLANRLMPQVGYNWIFENQNALNMWIALLSEDREGGGVLSLYIERASEILEEYKANNAEYYVPNTIEEFLPIDTKDAELFLAWYLQELEKEKIKLLQISDEESLITQDIIERYCAMHEALPQCVLDALKRLGVIKGGLETFYTNDARHKLLSPGIAKQQKFGDSSSLFTTGLERDMPHVSEEQTKVGLKFEGYVAFNILLGYGFLPPIVFHSAISLVSIKLGKLLVNKLPQLERYTNDNSKIVQPPVLTINSSLVR